MRRSLAGSEGPVTLLWPYTHGNWRDAAAYRCCAEATRTYTTLTPTSGCDTQDAPTILAPKDLDGPVGDASRLDNEVIVLRHSRHRGLMPRPFAAQHLRRSQEKAINAAATIRYVPFTTR